MDRLPPLTALRAFEAAARHLSFTRAAAELSVTPAALSFQIRSLEEHLGRPLFHRLTRAVALTEAGRALAPGASEGFSRLAVAWRAAQRSAGADAITVTAGPAFTAKWLAPRIFGFAAAHPQIEMRFAASLRIMDFERDEIDVAIRFGYGPDAGLYSEPLVRDWVTPMVSPDVARGLAAPADLARLPLLQQEDIAFLDPPLSWGAWFDAAGVPPPAVTGSRFSQGDHALDAAQAGGGAVLGRISLATAALRSGALVAPFDLALTTEAQYRIVCAAGTQERPATRAFLEWLRAEAADFAAFDAGRRFVAAG